MLQIQSSPPSLLSFALLALLGTGCQPQANAPEGFPPVVVEMQPALGADLVDSSEFVGTLEAQERVVLKPQVEGKVVEILVAEGDEVTQGTPILQLRPDRQQAEVAAAQATTAERSAALKSAQADVKGAIAEIARLEADVERHQAELASADADWDLANNNYQRAETLVKEGVQPQQALDDRRRERDRAIANRLAAQKALKAARLGLEVAQERLSAAQATVAERQAALGQAQSNVQVHQEDLGYHRVLAPINGMVGDIPIEVGDYVGIGEALTTLTLNDKLDLAVSVPVERRSQLQPGLTVELEAEGLNTKVVGQLSFISPRVDMESQSILVKATFPNPDDFLQDGQFVRVRILWRQRPGVLIPTTAVSRLGGQAFVFVAQEKDGQQVALQRQVELGTIQGNDYQVLKGIAPGEAIITSGVLNLRDGVPITLADQAQKP